MIWWIVLLFLVGMALIMAEFLLPGAICGVFGSLLIVSSCVLGGYSYPEHALIIISGEVVGSVLCILIGIFLLSKSGAGKRLILSDSQQANRGWVASETDPLLIGATGIVYTALRPVGTIVVNGNRISAVADGNFIDKGAIVRVTEVHGNRVVVELVTIK